MRPSDVLGIKNELIAYDFDASVFIKASLIEQQEYEKEKMKAKGKSTGSAANLKLMKAKADILRKKNG